MSEEKHQASPSGRPRKKPGFHNGVADYIKYSGMGFQMVGALLLAYWGGRKLDAWLGGGVLWTAILLAMTSVATMLSVIFQVLKGKD